MKLNEWIGDRAFYRGLFALSAPLVLQQLITASIQIVDNVMVGQLGETAIGAVGVINQLFFVVIITSFGVMSGSTIYMAQYYGAKNEKKLQQSFHFTLLAAMFVGIVSFLLFTYADDALIGVFTQSTETTALAKDYISIIRFGLFAFAISIAISSSLRVVGITKPILWISVVTILLNTALNAILIFGLLGFPAMGVVGAAIATLIARVVEAVLSLWYLMRRQSILRLDMAKLFSIEWTLAKAIVIIGLPLLLNEFLWSLGQTTYLFVYSTRGDGALAAMNVTNTISQITFVMFQAIGAAAAVFVGNKLGENALEEAQLNSKRLILIATVFAIGIGVLQFAISFFVLDIYSVSEATKLAAQFNIRVNSLFVPLYTMNVTMFFIIRSGGDTVSTFLMDSGFMWVIAVPVALGLAFFTALPITIMFLLIQGTELLKVAFAYHRFSQKRWVKNLANTPDVVTLSL
jgi:putative MATE family efflux protein